jgi:hypothetical protein
MRFMGMAVLQGLKDDTVYAYSFVINPFLRQLANQESTLTLLATQALCTKRYTKKLMAGKSISLPSQRADQADVFARNCVTRSSLALASKP